MKKPLRIQETNMQADEWVDTYENDMAKLSDHEKFIYDRIGCALVRLKGRGGLDEDKKRRVYNIIREIVDHMIEQTSDRDFEYQVWDYCGISY